MKKVEGICKDSSGNILEKMFEIKAVILFIKKSVKILVSSL